MTSFTRTIPVEENAVYVDEILHRFEHRFPLAIFPQRASKGDHLDLVYRGQIVARVRIDSVVPAPGSVLIGSDQRPYPANWLVRYSSGWERAPRPIAFRGHQGIRYLDTIGMRHLDAQAWPPVGKTASS